MRPEPVTHIRKSRSASSLFAVLLALTVSGCEPFDGDDESGEDRPLNIVFVLLDDATKSHYNAKSMPFTWRYMRNHGTTFDDYLVTTPLCCPARASILTGQYGHNNGVLSNTYGDLRDPGDILPAWLQGAGYRTAHVGKYLNGSEEALDNRADASPGWDEWYTVLEPQSFYGYQISDNGTIEQFGDEDEDYLTRVLSDKAAGLVEELAGSDEPFFLELDHYAPHRAPRQPGGCRHAAPPDPLDVGKFEGAHVPRSPALFEVDRSDKPSFIQNLPAGTPAALREADLRYACALGSLLSVDRGFEQLVSALDESGVLDRTAIIFSSDNGVYYGEHGVPDEKHFPYREAYEVPLQIALPDETPRRVDAPAASIDLAPTMLEIAAGEPCVADGGCRPLDGRSLMPVLEGGADPSTWLDRPRGLELTLPGNSEPFDRVCEYFGVRSGRWAYVHHVTAARVGEDCLPSGEAELYDIVADPHQLENLAGTGRSIEPRLHQLALQVRACEGAACRRP